MRNKRIIKLLAHVCRTILALTFLLSGFVKTIDPWGTALKVNEYLTIYGWDALKPAAMGFSIWLCGAELMMGAMLLFKVRIRLVSIFALLSMIIFTVITFLSATVLPVEDCGCFGDALKLTPWQTFVKNLIALPMAFIVWWRYRPDRIFQFNRLEFALMCLFFGSSMRLGYYCYRHLPLIDFLPYRVGVHIQQAMSEAAEAEPTDEEETLLVFRNVADGSMRTFTLEDPEWQQNDQWEWVETQSVSSTNVVRPLISEFALHNADGDATQEILSHPGRLYMLCVTTFSQIPQECSARMKALVEQATAQGDRVICLTPEPLYGETTCWIGDQRVACYNIDASTMKTLLRADNGLVVLQDGVIEEKYNCLDIKP